MKKTLLFAAAAMVSGFTYGQMLPGGGFESWADQTGALGTYPEPDEWNTANECADGAQSSVTESADAYSGMASARLETLPLQFPAGWLMNGVLTTADMICSLTDPGQQGGYDYTSRPDSITAWIKYAPATGDSAYVQVIMFGDMAGTDTIAYNINHFHAAAAWTKISFPINWLSSGSPMLASVLFNSSWGAGNLGEGVAGSVLYVDDVAWAMTVGIDEVEASKWKVYPNPVQGDLTVTAHEVGGRIEVLDVTGKEVMKERMTELEAKFDLSSLPTGIYLYQLKTAEEEVVKTGKLLVNP